MFQGHESPNSEVCKHLTQLAHLQLATGFNTLQLVCRSRAELINGYNSHRVATVMLSFQAASIACGFAPGSARCEALDQQH